MDEAIAAAIGTVNERVTHWGISRLEKGEWTRLESANEDGVRVREWPIEELSLENIRLRWSEGEFRCHWFENDPNSADPKTRRKSAGHSCKFGVEPEAARVVSTQPRQAPGLMTGGMTDMLTFIEMADRRAAQQIELSERRAAAQLEAFTRLVGLGPHAAPPAQDGAALAQLAELRANLAERDRREALEREHRVQIERLERRVREAEDTEPEEAAIQPREGAGFIEQIGAGIASAMVEAAKKNPELVMGTLGAMLGPLASKMVGAEAPPQPAPAPPVQTRQMPAPNAPPPPAETPIANAIGTPIVDNPAAAAQAASSAPPARVVVEATRTGIPVHRAATTNGAAAVAQTMPAPAQEDAKA